MLALTLRYATFALALTATALPAAADQPLPAWNHGADTKMTRQTALTIAPILPIFPGTLDYAKLSNGAKLVKVGAYRDLRDGRGMMIARFDVSGRTLEPIDRPIDLVVTPKSVVFLGAKKTTLMTLPRANP